MNVGQVEYAERKAMELFDQWNDVTGVFRTGSSYYSEMVGCIEDAVHIGIQMALKGKVSIVDGRVVRGDPHDIAALEMVKKIINAGGVG